MADRTQRVKGKANEAAGRSKTGAKGTAQTVKGKTQQAVGKARSTAKKTTR